MTNRRLSILLLLVTLLLTLTLGSIAQDYYSYPYPEFDRRACYAKCPCYSQGFWQACADCRQKCEREFWKHFDESVKKLEKD
jgi:hypothetical protein